MALYTPKHGARFFKYNNFGANPSATFGTLITPGNGSKGAWAQVASSANISRDIDSFYVDIHTGATSAATRPQSIDIGVDPAGGTSYTPIIQNLFCGNAPGVTAAGERAYFFPMRIRAGSSVAVRSQSNATTTFRVGIEFYGQPSAPEMFPVGSFSETFGVSGSSGTSITPGNAADGAWALIGTTTKPLWWWQLGYTINNVTITAEYTYLELAFGDASNKYSIQTIMHGGTTAEVCYHASQPHLLWPVAYCPVAGGTNLYVRGRCVNAPDTGYQVGIVGIGG